MLIRGMLSCVVSNFTVLFCLVQKKPENNWQKVDYIVEFSEWMYYKQFPLEDVFDHLEWAIEILLCMKATEDALESDPKKEGEGGHAGFP